MSRVALLSRSYSAEVLADSPVLYYRLGDAAGATTVADSSGNGLTSLTLGSGVHTGYPGGLAGDANKGIFFDGVNFAKLSCPSDARLNTASFSCEFLAKVVDATYTPTWAGKGSANWDVVMKPTGQVRASSNNTTNLLGSDAGGIYTPILPKTNVWSHVVVTFDSTTGTMALWVNGLKRAQATGILATINTSGSLQFGSSSPAFGYGDEFAFYNTPLADARIVAHNAARLAPVSRAVVV